MEIDSIFEELQKYYELDPENGETWIYMAKEKVKRYLLQKNKKLFEDITLQLTPKNLPSINNGTD